MTTLAVDKGRIYERPTDENDLPMVASDIIYEGAAVGIVAGSGHARPLVAGDAFAGFALEKADNSAGGAAAITVHLRTEGRIKLAVGSVAITNIGARVYASDDDTFTLTASTNTLIGYVERFVSSGIAIVRFAVGPTFTAS